MVLFYLLCSAITECKGERERGAQKEGKRTERASRHNNNHNNNNNNKKRVLFLRGYSYTNYSVFIIIIFFFWSVITDMVLAAVVELDSHQGKLGKKKKVTFPVCFFNHRHTHTDVNTHTDSILFVFSLDNAKKKKTHTHTHTVRQGNHMSRDGGMCAFVYVYVCALKHQQQNSNTILQMRTKPRSL